ncbi:hypothetical protein HIM_07469 [Hirsutella minnesotensis 3608]|uniref:Uncharacterized protein n=1 Tax=Hirsutella minnesotensis 3608 TaxID=1043627 RepID=A0A0F7ZN40_9HYPO|nr:hypothetical protein HIM_07469 [Hirsutella minnesotensis 3608]
MAHRLRRALRRSDREDRDYEEAWSFSHKSRGYMDVDDWDDYPPRSMRPYGGPMYYDHYAGPVVVRTVEPKEKPKEKPKAPECNYKCCQCKVDKKKEEDAKKCCHCVSPPSKPGCCAAPAPAPAPAPSQPAPCSCTAHKPADEKKPEEKKTEEKKPEPAQDKDYLYIHVRDRTGSPLADRHGDRYEIAIAPKATADDIISLLVPDRKSHKVRVLWRDGELEDLDDLVEFDDIRRFAKRLYIDKRIKVRLGR